MAVLDVALYDSSFYDDRGVTLSGADAAALGFSGGSLTATPVVASDGSRSHTQVSVSWDNPLTPHLARVIVRSTAGYSTDPRQGVALYRVVTDPLYSTASVLSQMALIDTVPAGSEVFYTFYVSVSTGTNTSVWLPIGSDALRMTTDHGSFERLRSAMPHAFTSVSGTETGGEVSMTEPLSLVLSAMADFQDALLTDADRIGDLWDPNAMSVTTVTGMSQMLGLPVEPGLGPKAQRQLLANFKTLYSRRGTYRGLSALAECITGRDISMVRGKNLLPSTAASAYENHDSVATSLAVAAAPTDQTITVASTAGLPLPTMSTGVLRQPIWVTVRSASFTESMIVTRVVGRVLTVDRGTSTTSGRYGQTCGTHAIGSTVTYQVNWAGWDTPPGLDVVRLTSTDLGFALPVATSTSADQPPAQNYALRITQNVAGLPAPQIAYGPRRYLAAYSRTGTAASMTTRQPHALVRGQRVTTVLGSLAPTAWAVVDYTVSNVVDAFTVTFTHTETGLGTGTTTLPTTDLQASTPPYLLAHPHPITMIAVTGGIFYTYSAYLRAVSTGRSAVCAITWWSATGQQISDSPGSSSAYTSGGWTRIYTLAVSPANAVAASLSVRWGAAWANAEQHLITQHQFESSVGPSGYDDGGLVRIGINARTDIDPAKMIRSRTKALAGASSAERPVRVEFLNTAMVVITTNGVATLNHSAALWSTLDVRARVKFSTLSGTSVIMRAGGSTRYWSLNATSSQLQLVTTLCDVAATTLTYTATHGLSTGTTYWVRVTRTSGGTTTFYTAPDAASEPNAWTQVGQTIPGVGTPGAADLGSIPEASSAGTGTTSQAKIQTMIASVYAVVARGANGYTVVEFDPTLWDTVRLLAANPGSTGGQWLLTSTDASIPTITTSFP